MSDDGEGIFLRIQRALDLFGPREAILELAQGKFTTDPAHHSGEGIFFSSKVFDKFAAPEEYTFAKTIVPVKLAQHEGEKLVSRSQAKRLTMRFERFQTVVLDFAGVEEIGQAFADEVFRVFRGAHPQTTLVPENMAPGVKSMVSRARAQGRAA